MVKAIFHFICGYVGVSVGVCRCDIHYVALLLEFKIHKPLCDFLEYYWQLNPTQKKCTCYTKSFTYMFMCIFNKNEGRVWWLCKQFFKNDSLVKKNSLKSSQRKSSCIICPTTTKNRLVECKLHTTTIYRNNVLCSFYQEIL